MAFLLAGLWIIERTVQKNFIRTFLPSQAISFVDRVVSVPSTDILDQFGDCKVI